VLPLAQENGALKIIMSDPSDFDTVQKLQFILNKDIQPVLAPREQIVEAINRHYGQSETESVDSMLAEFTDTAIDFTETEGQDRDIFETDFEVPALADDPESSLEASDFELALGEEPAEEREGGKHILAQDDTEFKFTLASDDEAASG